MKASLLTIGDELLSGKTTNTNATWISRNLTLAGCNVVRNVTVRDKEKEILISQVLLWLVLDGMNLLEELVLKLRVEALL